MSDFLTGFWNRPMTGGDLFIFALAWAITTIVIRNVFGLK